MIQPTTNIQKISIAIIFLTISLAMQANESSNFMPPEVAAGAVSCKAEWNQICEDQKTIKVPEGHKLCKNIISEKEKNGDSAYELVSTDNQSVTIKFYAKGNRDRFKQQSASIVLSISLLGVRENTDCLTGISKNTAATLTTAPVPVTAPTQKTENETEKKLIQAAEIKNEAKPAEAAAPVVETTHKNKPDACACSQWIDADKVFDCLVKGHARDNASCDSFASTIACVSSKEECRELQKDNCPQVMGLNRSTSNKRLFVANSIYCQQQ